MKKEVTPIGISAMVNEFENYEQLLKEWEKEENNKNRSYARKRDDRSLEIMEQPPIYRNRLKIQANTSLRKGMDFEDIIFSGNPDGLHELISDGALSFFLKELTSKQKEVIYYKVIQRCTDKETGAILGISDRRVREIYKAAIVHIRGKMYPIIKFRRKLETDERYRYYARGRGIYTTKAERDFADKAETKTKSYYD